MSAGIAWLKPTRIKLIFLLEWSLFLLIEMARGRLKSGHSILVAAYPLIFFYLIACALVAMNRHTHQIAQGWKLLALAVGLVLFDQVIKIIVTTLIPNNASIPVVKNWFHIAHVRNYEGSWVAGTLNLPVVIHLAQWGAIIFVLLLSIFYHHHYIMNHRHSLWVDAAFLGIFTACASWICDMTFRGYIVDFIALPDLVTADLKDIFVTIGAAAFLTEYFDYTSHFTNQERKS